MSVERLKNLIRPKRWDAVKEMERYEHLSVHERGRLIEDLCALAAEILKSREDRLDVLGRQEPRPGFAEAWWRELVLRGRRQAIVESD